jgi:uncharacterized membrane-anchored protein YjiN (DUF445 family)
VTPDDVKRARLRRISRLASGLLVGAAGLYGVALAGARLLPHPAWAYVAAFAEAAMVGGLADWFAVVALFRHPLGLKFVPHTAILPANKNRIANNLGEFVQREFFSPERVTGVVTALRPAARAARWLSAPRNAERIGTLAVTALVQALEILGEAEVRAHFRRAVASVVGRLDLASAGGTLLDALTHEGRHQELLDHMLRSTSAFLNDPEVRSRIVSIAAEHLPLYFDALKQSASKVTIAMFVRVIGNTFADIDANPEHPLRIAFDRKLAELIDKLRHDDAYRERIEEVKQKLLADPALAAYIDGLWSEMAAWLRTDLERDDSTARARVVALAGMLGRTLAGDAPFTRWADAKIVERMPGLASAYGPRLATFIAERMKAWDDREIVEKLELNIGPDLQYVRFNGTIIGGVAGLLIYALTRVATG